MAQVMKGSKAPQVLAYGTAGMPRSGRRSMQLWEGMEADMVWEVLWGMCMLVAAVPGAALKTTPPIYNSLVEPRVFTHHLVARATEETQRTPRSPPSIRCCPRRWQKICHGEPRKRRSDYSRRLSPPLPPSCQNNAAYGRPAPWLPLA